MTDSPTVAESPISVVIPTLGRIGLLTACLDSIAACRPLPHEVLLVTQGAVDEVEELAGRCPGLLIRVVPCAGSGVSRGRNLGLREASNESVLVTDDDCTVPSDWVERAREFARRYPGAIVTGRVLPAGDPLRIPSSKIDEEPHDFAGEVHAGALFPNNMLLPRTAVLGSGGFDERFGPGEAAEDNEFCYRWLRAGGSLRYEPALVVWHHDWRTEEELERLYLRYGRGQGFFYAKHLLRGDLRMLRYLARDLWWGLRSLVARVLLGRRAWEDPRAGLLRGLGPGFLHGLRLYGGRRGRGVQ